MKLTLQLLEHEYMTWTLSYGANTNLDDFKFGAFIHEKYDTSHLKTDVSSEKDTEKSFIALVKELYEKHEKQQYEE
jgi:hypothetical protein